MNKPQLTLLCLALALIAGTGGLLAHVRAHQRLGNPGVTTHRIAGSDNLQVDLPEHVLDYASEFLPPEEIVTNTLPRDTSFGARKYTAPDSFMAVLNVVLMGKDRTSLHKPQFCLEGAGWRIDPNATVATTIHIDRPITYDLPVVKLVATKLGAVDGKETPVKAVYVYWFVADGAMTAGELGMQRMWWMFKELVRTGVLQRWAYVSCISYCAPGQEDATFERMKKLIAASVPEFQLTPKPAAAAITAKK